MIGPSCKNCPYRENDDECKDALCYGYCPDFDDEEDIGSAIVREMRLQNGDY